MTRGRCPWSAATSCSPPSCASIWATRWRARSACTSVYVIGTSAILLFKPGIDAPFPIGILPYHGYGPLTENPLRWLHSPVVPWIVAGAPPAAVCLRMTRSSIAEIRGEDFIRTAAAKGLTPAEIARRHVVPVAMPPVVSRHRHRGLRGGLQRAGRRRARRDRPARARLMMLVA